MKRFLICLAVLVLTALPAFAEESQDTAIFLTLQESYPDMKNQSIDQWGDAAAAVLENGSEKILCILEKQDGAWRITLQNPHALLQDEPLPSLFMDTDNAIFWSYEQMYPIIEFASIRTDGVWNVSQCAKTTSGNVEVIENSICYSDGEIVHDWFLFDENGNMLRHSVERMPTPWLSDCADLKSFDISRFPVIGYVEYDGEWPSIAFIKQAANYLMPDYTFVSGSFAEGRLRFLMDKPDGTRVFVGCGTGKNPALIQSTPLPAGTTYGVENFTNSLPIDGLCVTLSPLGEGEGNWGIGSIVPYAQGIDLLSFWPNCVYAHMGEGRQFCFGENPWSDITRMDWTSLPKSFQEAADRVNGDGWAMVNNPDPADRLHLREEPDTKSASLGKYYNGTPVKIIKDQNDWVQVEVFGVSGWMLKEYLSFTQPYITTLSAMPQLQFKNGTARLYASPDSLNAYQDLDDCYDLYVIGVLGNEWYHVWFPNTGMAGYIRQSELFPGNG